MKLQSFTYSDGRTAVTEVFYFYPCNKCYLKILGSEKCIPVSYPRLTIAGVVLSNGTIRFGVATCDKTDNFVKKIGRELAVKYAMSEDAFTIKVDNYKKCWNDFYSVAQEIEDFYLKSNDKKLYNKIVKL